MSPSEVELASVDLLVTRLLASDARGADVLTGVSEVVRVRSAAVLGHSDDPRAARALADLLHDRSRLVRASATTAFAVLGERVLGERKDVRALWPLVDMLREPVEATQQSAIRALAGLGPSARSASLDMLQSCDADVRGTAALALGVLGGVRAREALCSALDDPCASVRRDAASALGTLRNGAALSALVKTLQDGAPEVRIEGARALGRLGDPRAVEPLMSALRGGDAGPDAAGVRRAVAESLAMLGDARNITPLSAAVVDNTPVLTNREEAAAWLVSGVFAGVLFAVIFAALALGIAVLDLNAAAMGVFGVVVSLFATDVLMRTKARALSAITRTRELRGWARVGRVLAMTLAADSDMVTSYS